jgi:hypothetical protein
MEGLMDRQMPSLLVAKNASKNRSASGDTVHVERVEADLCCHDVSPDFRRIQASAPASETCSRSRIWAWRSSSRSKLQTSCRKRENSGGLPREKQRCEERRAGLAISDKRSDRCVRCLNRHRLSAARRTSRQRP